MDTPALAPETEERVRECTLCPPWVLRCAHWESSGVVMVGLHGTKHDDHANRVLIVHPMSSWVACRYCGDLHCREGAPTYFYGDDYDAALAAFYEAEERLLRGEP